MIALDTNLLVYAHRSAVAEHRSARQAIVRARTSSGGWGFSLPVVGEFWSVVTHPTAAGRPSAPEEAHREAAEQALVDAGDGAADLRRIGQRPESRRHEDVDEAGYRSECCDPPDPLPDPDGLRLEVPLDG